MNKQEECKITFERKAIYLMKNNKAKKRKNMCNFQYVIICS